MASVLTEEWRSIESFLGYEISNLGRVRSPRQILKTPIRGAGYPCVCIRKVNLLVHRLIAKAFLGPPPSAGANVNHKDGVRANSVLDNLEWTTPGGNQKHRYRVLGHPGTCLGKFSADHPTSRAVIATHMKNGTIARYASGMDAVRDGFRSDCISRACQGQIAHHAGHFWRYA